MSALSADGRLGIWLAHKLNLPLTIAGRKVRVPADLAAACAPPDDEGDSATPAEPVDDIRLAQHLTRTMELAAEEIATLGLDLGVIIVETPAPEPGPHFMEHAVAPAQPPPDTTIAEVGGEVWIGSPPVAAVRSSDGTGGGSWIVVSFKSNTILSWHARKGDATVWAIEHVKNGMVRGTGDTGTARRTQTQIGD